jgi:hypothetical protein
MPGISGQENATKVYPETAGIAFRLFRRRAFAGQLPEQTVVKYEYEENRTDGLFIIFSPLARLCSAPGEFQ